MTEPSEEMKAMARRVADKTAGANNSGYTVWRFAYEGALAAIIETQEACAKVADAVVSDCEPYPNVPERRASKEWARRIAAEIRTGNHYGKDESHD